MKPAAKKPKRPVHYLHGSFMKAYTECGRVFNNVVWTSDESKLTCKNCLRAIKEKNDSK